MKQTSKAGAFALALMIFQLITSYLILALGVKSYLLQNAITYVIAFGIPVVIYFVATKSKAKSVLFFNEMNLYNAVLIIAFSFLVQPVLYLISGLSTFIFPNEVAGYLMDYSNMGYIPLMISLAFLPAVFEEICYRGIVFYGYGNVDIKKAAVMSGFIFAIAHLSAQQFFYSFFMGVIFSLMVYYTRSIFSSTLSHFIINAVQVAALKASAGMEGVAETAGKIAIEELANLGIIALASLPLLIFISLTFIKINSIPSKKESILVHNENILQHNPDKKYEEKAITIPIIVLTVFYILMTIVSPMLV